MTDIGIEPLRNIETEYIDLTTNGELIIKKGYAWNGASGIPDTSNIMRGSLVHDALYQLMRTVDHFDKETYRDPVDRLLQQMCIKDGMNSIFAWIVYKAVKTFGDPAADPVNRKPVIKAPESCQ